MEWKQVVKHTCLLGECPVWQPEARRIWWVDILGKKIHHFCLDQQVHNAVALDQMPGAIALTTSGEILVASGNGFGLLDVENGNMTIGAETESEMPDNRFNDGKCDPAGRFWAGTMAFSGTAGAGNVYALEQDWSVSEKITGVTVSNGMGWSPDQTTFYYIDTATQQVVAYEYEASTGIISNKRVVIEIPQKEGTPDGMTIDSEGMLWTALFGGWKVARWDPKTGKMLCSISLPVSQVTSCAFGGTGLEDLYISSARVGLSKAELEREPLAGSIFVVENTGFKGLPAYRFHGG